MPAGLPRLGGSSGLFEFFPRDPSFGFSFGGERSGRRGWTGPRYSDFYRKRPIFQRDNAVGPFDERARLGHVDNIA